MKKIIFNLILLLSADIVFSQQLTNILGSIKIGNKSFHKGDTIIVYEPRNNTNQYESIFTNPKLTLHKSRLYKYSADNSIEDYSYIYYKIKNIKTAPDGRIIFSDGGFFPNYIDIKKALELNEVLSDSLISYIASPRYLLTDTLAFVQYYKLADEPKNDFWVDYLFMYKNDLYKKTHEDEFEYYAALNQVGEDLNELSEKIDMNVTYSLKVTSKLGEYDFSNQLFPINEEGNLLKVYYPDFFCKCNKGKIYLKLSNLSSFDKLPLNANEAKQLIAKKKDKFGNVDRKIYLRFNVRITEDLSIERNDAYIGAEIVSIDVFSEKDYIHGWVSTIH